MTALFRRVVNVVVAPKTDAASGGLRAIESSFGFDLSELACSFRVKKNLKSEPNTCELKVMNLSATTRAVLETPKKLVLRLEAGYPDSISQLFLGEIRSAQTNRSGADLITDISTGDSEKEMATSRIAISVGADIPAATVLKTLAKAMKVGPGNVDVAAARLSARGSKCFGKGTAIYGSAADELTYLCRSVGLTWSIQDGNLQFLELGKPLEAKAVLLSSDTGLIGFPSIDHKGIVTATALIQPDLAPGRKVQFDATFLKGGYQIQECEYSGDTAGDAWEVKMSLKKY